MPVTCCEYTGPAIVGDTAAVITVYSGTGSAISGVDIYAEGCDGENCSYQDEYEDVYCDVTEGNLYPNARITDIVYTITDMPAEAILVIDAAERTVTLTDLSGNTDLSQLNVLDWNGLFEWIEAARSGCQRICIDTTGATINGDTDVVVTTYDREL